MLSTPPFLPPSLPPALLAIMAFIVRAAISTATLSVTHKLLIICPKNYYSYRPSFFSSSSNPLLSKLLSTPIPLLKSTLDSELSSSSDVPFETLVLNLNAPSPHKAHLAVEWKLEHMLEQSVTDCNSYSELISICGRIHNLPLSLQVFASMEANGIKPITSVFNSLVKSCLLSGNMMTALSVYEIMQNSEDYKCDADTFNTFIHAFAMSGNFNSMLAWYLTKRSNGFSADHHTYEYLICGSVRSHNFEQADKFYEEMVLSGITPDIVILENMLEGQCKRNNLNKAKEVLKIILDSCWDVTEKMAKNMVELYSAVGRVEEMEELLEMLLKSNQNKDILVHVHFGIIRKYAMADRLNDVEYAVGRMLKDGILFKSPDDVEKVICSYFRQEAYDRLDMFLENIKDLHDFRRSTYDLLISGYQRARLFDKVELLVNEMKLAGFY